MKNRHPRKNPSGITETVTAPMGPLVNVPAATDFAVGALITNAIIRRDVYALALGLTAAATRPSSLLWSAVGGAAAFGYNRMKGSAVPAQAPAQATAPAQPAPAVNPPAPAPAAAGVINAPSAGAYPRR
jgi:hypothetical protein